MTRSLKRLIDLMDDVGMFFLTVFCVFISSYVPAFQRGEALNIDFGIPRFAIAAVLGLLLTGVFELKGIVNAKSLEEKAAAKAGRRRNAWLRIIISIVLGLCWPTVVSKVAALLGVGG